MKISVRQILCQKRILEVTGYLALIVIDQEGSTVTGRLPVKL